MLRGSLFRHLGRRLMSSAKNEPFIPIIITDPSYVKNSSDYDENISPDLCGDPTHKTPLNYVRLNLQRSLFDSLSESKHRFICPSPEGDEMFISIGPLKPLAEYEYLGSHHSDSGLTCILREGVYEAEEGMPPVEEMDWLELVTGSLEKTMEGAIDIEAFPMLQFCASVPEEDSAIAVYGLKENQSGQGYNSLVLRAWYKVFSDD